MMATTAMQLAIDALDQYLINGIAEMSELPKEVRTRTDILIVGNTTAATGKVLLSLQQP
jgi:K(+)-stimulated pyrophosphate-energized sodium pump